MGKLMGVEQLFEGRHFDREGIILCVRWYLRFKLSLRDLAEMMAERGLSLAHTTTMRWVWRYAPEFEKRWKRFAQAVGRSKSRMSASRRASSGRRRKSSPSSRRRSKATSQACAPPRLEVAAPVIPQHDRLAVDQRLVAGEAANRLGDRRESIGGCPHRGGSRP
jgi:hypothetical protein